MPDKRLKNYSHNYYNAYDYYTKQTEKQHKNAKKKCAAANLIVRM